MNSITTTAAAAQALKPLSMGAKLLLEHITLLAQQKGYAHASQEMMALHLGRSVRTVRSYVAELLSHRLIDVEVTGHLRTNRYRLPELPPTRQKTASHPAENCLPPGRKLPPTRQKTASHPAIFASNIAAAAVNELISSSSKHLPVNSEVSEFQKKAPDHHPKKNVPTGNEARTAFEALGVAAAAVSAECERNPAKAVCVAAWLKLELGKKRKPITNLIGFALTMLREGESYGFQVVDGHWLPPCGSGVGRAIARKQTAQKRQEDDQAARQAQEVAERWYADWKGRWDLLPASEQDAIEAAVNRDFPLWARQPREGFTKMSAILRALEARSRAPG